MKLKDKFTELMHNQALKQKLYVIIFEADTPAGKLFDVTLIWCILLSVGLVILESLQGLPVWLKTPFIVMEYLLTAFFTFEYIINPEKPDAPLYKNDAFQKVQKRRVPEKR